MKFSLATVFFMIFSLAASTPQSRFKRGSKWDLHMALWTGTGNEAEARRLIENGAKINLADADGQLPIHWAALRGFDEIVRILLERGGIDQINRKDNRGETPLHKAAWQANEKVVRVLLAHGADIHSKDNKGMEPRDIAALYSTEEMVELLDAAAKQPIAHTPIINTPIHNTPIQNTPTAYIPTVNTPIASKPIVADKTSHVSGNTQADDLLEAAKPFIDQKEEPIPTKVSQNAQASQIACQKYLNRVPDDFILGGTEAQPNEFPWMAALGYLDSNNGISFECAGTIISEKFVLTAAHCTPNDHRPVIVRAGSVGLGDKSASNHYIREIMRHEKYLKIFKKNDIALIRLANDLVFTSEIRPACLESDLNDLSPDVHLNVTGWGSTSATQTQTSNELLKALVVTMPLSQCNQTYWDFNQQANQEAFRNGISQSQYCAFDPIGSADSCSGDSGGPLQVFHHPYTAHVVGIVSFSIGCGTVFPGVYTRVASYLDWITAHVWPEQFKG